MPQYILKYPIDGTIYSANNPKEAGKKAFLDLCKYYNYDQSRITILENNSKKELRSNDKKVTSPIIGTAYHAPEPGGKKFVEVGKKVKKGDTIMIVEAMKTMNHVPSTLDGVVKEITVSDGQPVEFGQTLIILE